MVILDASSPIRRSDDCRELSNIPPEIYLKVWDHLPFDIGAQTKERNKILCNLALVCRLFCSISQPIIFEKFRMKPTPSEFCAALLQQDSHARHIAGFVKELTLDAPQSQDYAGVLEIPVDLMPALAQMFKVQKVSLQMIHLSPELIQWMSGLRHLLSINLLGDFTLVNNQDAEDKPVHSLPESVQIAWHTQTLISLNSNPFDSPHYRALLGPNLTVLRTGCKPLVEWLLAASTDFRHLTHLDLGEVTAGLQPLYRFLAATPSISQFTIMKTRHDHHPTYPESDDKTLPNLRRLRCSASMLPALCRNQPLTFLSIGVIQYHVDIFHRFTDLSECMMETVETIIAHGRHLVALHIPVSVFRRFTGYGNDFPSLKTLDLIYFHSNLDIHDDAAKLKPVIQAQQPNLDALISLLIPGPRLDTVEHLSLAKEFAEYLQEDTDLERQFIVRLADRWFCSLKSCMASVPWRLENGTWSPQIQPPKVLTFITVNNSQNVC